MGLDELRSTWDRLGRDDPLWAVLTWPGTRGGRWDRKAFFEFGETEVSRALAAIDEVVAADGAALRRGRALDFGCGVGRLTQALAARFERCDGVDVAPSMIRLARRWNRHGDRARYHLVRGNDLGMFPDASFDFIYTAHVLQHMGPDIAAGYVADFVRLLAPGGYALLEVVTEPVVGAGAPLPDGAFAAELSIESLPRSLRAGDRVPLEVRVTNRGDAPWPAAGGPGQIRVGNQWTRGPEGAEVPDDGRVELPHDVGPRESCVVALDVTVPDRPGAWRLEVDVVQEGVAWFHHRGSTPAATDVEVLPRSRWTARRARGPEPVMEMHAMPEAMVTAWVEGAGGRVAGTFSWDVVQEALAPDWRRVGIVATR